MGYSPGGGRVGHDWATKQLSTAHSHSNIVKTVSWGLKWYIPLFPYHLLQNQSATINVQLQKYNLQGLEKNQPRGIKICLQLFTWTALPNETFINEGLISTENLHVFKCLFSILSYTYQRGTYYCSSYKWIIELIFQKNQVGGTFLSRMSYPQGGRLTLLSTMPLSKGISLEVVGKKMEEHFYIHIYIF